MGVHTSEDTLWTCARHLVMAFHIISKSYIFSCENAKVTKTDPKENIILDKHVNWKGLKRKMYHQSKNYGSKRKKKSHKISNYETFPNEFGNCMKAIILEKKSKTNDYVIDSAHTWIDKKELECHLVKIMKGKTPSKRHQIFLQGSKSLMTLYEACNPGYFGSDSMSVDYLLKKLQHMFLNNFSKASAKLKKFGKHNATYSVTVMVAEAIIWQHQMLGKSRTEAEELFMQMEMNLEEEHQISRKWAKFDAEQSSKHNEERGDEWVDHSDMEDYNKNTKKNFKTSKRASACIPTTSIQNEADVDEINSSSSLVDVDELLKDSDESLQAEGKDSDIVVPEHVVNTSRDLVSLKTSVDYPLKCAKVYLKNMTQNEIDFHMNSCKIIKEKKKKKRKKISKIHHTKCKMKARSASNISREGLDLLLQYQNIRLAKSFTIPLIPKPKSDSGKEKKYPVDNLEMHTGADFEMELNQDSEHSRKFPTENSDSEQENKRIPDTDTDSDDEPKRSWKY